MDILQKQKIQVKSENDLVILSFGNVEIKLPYETAFLLSQWLRVRAKEAKKYVGDIDRHWSMIGVLTDANVTRN